MIRLVRADHRRIGELLARLGRRYRPAAALRSRAAAELAAHSDASHACLLPLAQSRLDTVDPGWLDSLHAVSSVAADLEQAGDPVPETLLSKVVAALEEHVKVEENQVLAPLEGSALVPRLRRAGEAFQRRRDSAIKEHGGSPNRYQRPAASRAELYERARRLGVSGRSTMTREQLNAALREKP